MRIKKIKVKLKDFDIPRCCFNCGKEMKKEEYILDLGFNHLFFFCRLCFKKINAGTERVLFGPERKSKKELEQENKEHEKLIELCKQMRIYK